MEEKKFRFHVLGVPHTKTDPEWSACAFTMKVLKFCKMMTQLGHHVIHYGHEESNVICSEHVTVLGKEIFDVTYGKVDWKGGFFKYNNSDICYQTFYINTIEEIKKRFQCLDFVLLFWGYGHKVIADEIRKLRGAIMVEPGIGYPLNGIVYDNHLVFESYSCMNRYLGYLQGINGKYQPRYYDAVIPNYFDTADFDYDSARDGERSYFLYLGRIQNDKGLSVAVDTCRTIGAKLKVAGQGNLKAILGVSELPSFIEVVGYANPTKRKELLAGAKGLFAPTQYSEPFGGIAVEAMMAGVPAITTDWGAFPETVLHGITGFRCRTMAHFAFAAKNIDQIDRKKCREWAIANYSLEKVSQIYEEYFTHLRDLYDGKAFYHIKEFENLDWLKKTYPSE